MKIEHAALWVADLEKARTFFERYFGGKASPRYENAAKGFQSYFLTFDGGARLEVMSRTGLVGQGEERLGWAHLAMSVGSEAAVDSLTNRLVADGFARLNGPRRTGDGYYESVIADGEGNHIEITV